jgi:hypothetical protein
LRPIRGVIVFAAVLATNLTVTFYLTDLVHTTAAARAAHSAFWALAISAIPLVAILPTCLFAIRIEDGVISHLFLRRFALSTKPVSELEAVAIARGWGAVLKFKGGSKIRFLGAHLEELREMCRYLDSQRDGQVALSAGAVATALYTVADKFRRDA